VSLTLSFSLSLSLSLLLSPSTRLPKDKHVQKTQWNKPNRTWTQVTSFPGGLTWDSLVGLPGYKEAEAELFTCVAVRGFILPLGTSVAWGQE
jgi:hypothetical protein